MFSRFSIVTLIVVLVGHACALYGMTKLSEMPAKPRIEPVMEAVVIPPPPLEKPPEPPKPKEPKPKPKPKQAPKEPPKLPPPPAPPVPNENAVSPPEPAPANAVDGEPGGDEYVEKEPPVAPPQADPAHPNKAPAYPHASRKKHEEGTVLVELLVSEEGKVKTVRLKESSGFEALDKAALKAAKKWHFLPARRDGKPISFWHVQPVQFVMN